MPSAPLDHAGNEYHQLRHYDPPAEGHWSPVYFDEHLLIVDKPAGLLTVPGRGEHVQDCLIKRVQKRYPDALIVHRLDMDTSGLVLLALGAPMQRSLSGLFMLRQVDKRYEALVHGCPLPERGLIDLPLSTDWPRRPRQMVDHEGGKSSQTQFQVMPDSRLPPSQSRLSLVPLTGRTHQLRVHCLALGYPIVGDPLYGLEARTLRLDAQSVPVNRLMLHATSLEFVHPISGEKLCLLSPSPF